MIDSLPLAGRGRRLAATLIDLFVVPVVAFPLMLVTGVLEHAQAYAGNQPYIRGFGLGVAAYVLVNGWLLQVRGQTLGKAILGIMIVSHGTSDKAPLWKLILIRALFFPTLYLLPIIQLSLLAIVDQAFIFGKQRRCLHDLLCNTAVVVRGESQTSSAASAADHSVKAP